MQYFLLTMLTVVALQRGLLRRGKLINAACSSHEHCNYAISLESINEARERIKDKIEETPVLQSRTMNERSGRKLFFKCENFQRTGSFKVRGMSNALWKNAIPAAVVHSSGNMGIALSYGCTLKGIPAHIVMPNNAPACKVAAVKAYGGLITFCEPNLVSRENTANELVKQTGGLLIHAYNNPDVMSGQGSIALELLEQVDGLDAVIVPIGGGGMIAGIAMAIKSVAPHVKVLAAEPELANDAFRSKQAGELVGNDPYPETIADGLRTNVSKVYIYRIFLLGDTY